MYSKHTAAHMNEKKDVCYSTIQQDENKRSVKFPCRLLANKEFFFLRFVLRILNFFPVIKNCKYSKGHLYLTTYVFWILFPFISSCYVPFTVIWFIISRGICLVSIVMKEKYIWEQKHVPHTVRFKWCRYF